ncbi:hypothetical protein Pla22_25570 [Rubripirellula amarantea]|uniref:SGNH hydrolase-type esterase domain-containing protein n=1 Tax=Rubripirellula amarantea TaxID=2527999 RepID=A0A5C5WY19_9BACT|nr:hypothetical protein Pla22_25570 [Rubripirellula amarantea]
MCRSTLLNEGTAVIRYGCLLLLAVTVASNVDAQERVFEGPWNNRRTGASGTMTCNATEVNQGQWTAIFRGVFQGKPFEYKIDFQSKASGSGSILAGTTSIDGKRYEWNGTLQASQLRGRYQATNGWNGEFTLNETAASRRNVPMSVEPESIEEVEIKPVIQDGDHLLFIGNSYMANEGGVYNYLQAALKKRGIDITHQSEIAYGKPLSEMVTREVGTAMMDPKVDVVVITSGDLKSMQQFATKLKDSGKKLVVFMTWEGKHPGNQSSKTQYTSATRKAVRQMRELEKQTGATIIPSAVLYHDLTMNPPDGMPRIDYLWKQRNIHQNALGTMANALLMTAMLTGESPAGLNFDFPPHIVGQNIPDEPDLRFTRDLRETLQYRAWSVAHDWTKGRSHLEAPK